MAELFVVGVGRSGTSLLQSMLAAHRAVAMLPETSFLRRYLTGRKRSFEISASTAGELWERDERLRRLDRACWERAIAIADERTATRSRERPAGGSFDFRTIATMYQALLSVEIAAKQSHRDPNAVRYTADKDPRLVEYLPIVGELFPDSHIIHIVRDPRDVLLSKSKAAWSRKRGWRANAVAGRFQLDLGDRFGRARWGWRYHVVRYEELITSPERTLRRLTAELDLDFDPAMLDFGGAARHLGGDETEEWKRETLGPLLRDNRGKWRQGLTSTQVRFVESVYARWMVRFGYARAKTPRGARAIADTLARFGFASLSLIYRTYRMTAIRRVRRALSE